MEAGATSTRARSRWGHAERGLQHGRPAEAVTDADRRVEAQLVADGDEVGGVLVDRAPLPRRRPAAGAAADEVERRDPEAVEVEAFDEWVPRRVVVLEPVHEDEVAAGHRRLGCDGDLGSRGRSRPLTPVAHAQILARAVDDEAELGPLLVGGERVALDRAGEAALRAQAQLIHRHVAGRLLDPVPRARRSGSSVGPLGGDETEHDGRVLADVAQRGEVAGALVVVLEEEGVDVELVEQHLGHRFVAAFGEPRAAVVAAAQVDADREVVGAAADGGVDQLGVGVRQGVGIVAALDRAGAHHRIAEVREVGVVELEVAAAGGVQGVDLGPVAGGEIGEEPLEVGIGVEVDRRPPTAEVDHRRRRDRHLRRLRDDRLQVAEVVDLDVADVAQRPDDGEAGRRHVDGVGGIGAGGDVAGDGDAAELFEEVEVEPRPAVLAVRDAAHPQRLDLTDGGGDRLVLHGAQLVGGDRPGGPLGAGAVDDVGAQQAADLLGAERRLQGTHGRLSTSPQSGMSSSRSATTVRSPWSTVRVTSAHTPKRLAEPE